MYSFRTMFAVAPMTGVRSDELLGLKVDDPEFERRFIFYPSNGESSFLQTVKNKASRKPLPMPEGLARILKDYFHGWRENPDRWLFADRWSRSYGADKVVMSKLWPIMDAQKIPSCGLHAFRHFHSSVLLEMRASPQVAQAQLRHSDARSTLEVYSHLIGESQRDVVEKVAEILPLDARKQGVSADWIQ